MNRILLCIVLLMFVPVLASAESNRAQSELAEQWIQLADALADNPQARPAADALESAALRLIGDDARLLRLAIDVELKLGHREKAIELLGAYRKLEPADQLAQVQTIDLLIAGMQSADEKQKYLSQIAGSDALSNEVRSHASLLLVSIFLERGEDAQAERMLEQSLKLNPVNPKALQWVADRAYTLQQPAPKRAEALVNLLKSNPMQPATISALAEELLRVGAVDQAQEMYRKSFDINNLIGTAPSVDDAINFAVALLASDKARDAPGVASAVTQLAPSSARAWFIRVLAQQQAGDAKAVESTIGDARTALVRNVMLLHGSIDPKSPPVTDSTPAILPDVRADAAALAKSNQPGVTQAYATALSDLAWLDSYFAGQNPDAGVLSALAALTGENSVIVTRVQGFAALATGQDDTARVKLSAIADRDLLAKVGLLSLRNRKGEPKEALLAEASGLLAQMPADVWSAMIRHSLRDLGAVTFKTDDNAQVIAEAAKLPDKWFEIARNPGLFYLMELRPLRVGVPVGEPLVMKLRVQNTNDFPLVIGPGGVIDQTVAIDASTRGAAEQYFPGVGSAKLTGQLVLQPRQSVFTTVRVDNPDMAGFLNSAPHVSLTVFASAISNPRVGQNNAVLPGPGGLRVQADTLVDRQASPLAKETVRQQLTDQLAKGDPPARLLAFRTLSGNIALLQSVKQPGEAVQQLAALGLTMFTDALARESDPAVKAQTLQLLAGIQSDPKQVEQLHSQMLRSSDWESRLLGTLMTLGLPQAKRQELLKPLQADADEAVKQLAGVLVTIPDPKPTTEPADGGK